MTCLSSLAASIRATRWKIIGRVDGLPFTVDGLQITDYPIDIL